MQREAHHCGPRVQERKQEHTGRWASVSAYGIFKAVGTGPTLQCGIWCE